GLADRRRRIGGDPVFARPGGDVARLDVDRILAGLRVAAHFHCALQLHERAVAVDPGRIRAPAPRLAGTVDQQVIRGGHVDRTVFAAAYQARAADLEAAAPFGIE